MSANVSPIFPITPVIGIATLTGATAITSRANITGTTGLVQLTPATTNGMRVDAITVKGKGTNLAAANVDIWIFNGTTSYLYDEFDMSLITPGVTTDSVSLTKQYTTLILPPTYQLFVSEQVQADFNVFAFGGAY